MGILMIQIYSEVRGKEGFYPVYENAEELDCLRSPSLYIEHGVRKNVCKKEELQKVIKQLNITNEETIKIEENEEYLVFGSFLVVEKFLSLIGYNENS